jgi:hypothetical protein
VFLKPCVRQALHRRPRGRVERSSTRRDRTDRRTDSGPS